MRKLWLLSLVLVLLPSVWGAVQFQDEFTGNPRGTGTPANDIGNGWTEVGGDHTYISNEYIYTDPANRAIAQKILANYTWICYQQNDTNDYTGAITYFQYSGDRTIYTYWATDTQFQYYTGAIYDDCLSPIYVTDDSWICMQTVSPYSVYYGNDSSDMFEACQVSTTYDDGKTDYELGYNTGAAGRSYVWGEVCAADNYADCTDGVSVASYGAYTPVSGDKNNTQVVINMSCPDTAVDGYIWFNETYSAELSNATMVVAGDVGAYWLTDVHDSDTYYFVGGCHNSSTDVWATNATLRNFTYDVDSPVISFGYNNFFGSNNLSNENQFNDSVKFNLTFSDNFDLWLWDVNVTTGGVTVYNKSLIYVGGNTTRFFNESVDVSAWASGVYNVEVQVSDSHTAFKIPEYEVSARLNEVEFDTGNAVVRVSSEDAATTASVKYDDRYDFSFDFVDKEVKDRVFYVEAEGIEWLRHSPFKAHFVVRDGLGGNWIDFEGVDGEPVVEKVGKDRFSVTFSSLNEVTFRSIGGMNVVAVNYTWFRGNLSSVVPSGLVGENTSFSLNLTNHSSFSDVSTLFFYNHSQLESYETVGDSVLFESSIYAENIASSVPLGWRVNVTQSNGSVYSFDANYSHNVATFYLDNCTNGTQEAFSVYFYDEETPLTRLVADLEVEFNYTFGVSTLSYNASLLGENNYTFCISPPDTELQINAYFKYNVSGGFTHRYYLINETVNNVSVNYSLFNYDDDTGISDLLMVLRDAETYTYYPNVIAKLMRYYVSESVYRVVQMDESGDFGNVFFNVKEEDVDYKIVFLDWNNNVLSSTENLKFVCTAGRCDVTYLIYDTTGDDGDDVGVGVSYSNVTDLVTVTWADPEGDATSFNVKVTKESPITSTSICDVSVVGASGSYDCNVSGYTGTLWVRGASTSASGVSYDYGEYIEIKPSQLADRMSTSDAALWTVVIMLVIVGTGLYSPVGAVIAMIISLFTVYLIGLFNGITIVFISLACVIGVLIGYKVRK